MSKSLNPYRMFFVHVVLFGGLLLASFMAEAQESIVATLHCEQIQDKTSPNYLPSNDRVFDLRLNSENQIDVTYAEALNADGALLSSEDTVEANWTSTGNVVYAEWKNGVNLALVPFGSGWSGVIMFPSTTDTKVNPFELPFVELECGRARW